MRNYKWFVIICQILVLSTFLLMNAYAAQEKPIELTYCTLFPDSDGQGQLGKAWAKEIEKRTNGKVVINYIPGGEFVSGEYIYECVLMDAIDIGMTAFSYNRCCFPTMEAIDLPMGYPNAKVATSVINEFYNKFQPKELEDVKVLYLHAHGPGLLHSRVPVHKLEDIGKIRIRSTSCSAKITNALGAIPIVRPQGCASVLLADHYVEATWSPMEVLKGWQQAEVVKYTTESYCIGYTSGFYVAMNPKKWKSLPNDVQTVFEEVSKEWITKHAEAWDLGDEEGRKYTLKLGNKIIPLSADERDRWSKAVQPVIYDYAERIESKGLPGNQYIETIWQLIKKYQ